VPQYFRNIERGGRQLLSAQGNYPAVVTHDRSSDSTREREFEFLRPYVRGDQDHQVRALYEYSIGRAAQSVEVTSVTVRAEPAVFLHSRD
jgi:hypothetical protein